MKNYYDYGCGKGENHFYPRHEENHEQGCFEHDNRNKHAKNEKHDWNERNDYYNYSFGDDSGEKDELGERCHYQNCCSENCARVYSMKKHDCKCNEHKHCDEHSYCKDYRRCNEKKYCQKDHDGMDYPESKNNCFCFGICIPPFPFRCGK